MSMIRVYNISSVLGALHRWVEVMVVHVIHHDWHKQCSQRVQALFCMRGPTDCMQLAMCIIVTFMVLRGGPYLTKSQRHVYNR